MARSGKKSRGLRPLTKEEILAAFQDAPWNRFGPFLTPQQLGELIGVPRATIYFWIAQGRLDGAVRKRGKHWLIWRDRAIAILLDGPNWNNHSPHGGT